MREHEPTMAGRASRSRRPEWHSGADWVNGRAPSDDHCSPTAATNGKPVRDRTGRDGTGLDCAGPDSVVARGFTGD